MKKFFGLLLSLFFEEKCSNCGNPVLSDGVPLLCRDCLEKTQTIAKKIDTRCKICGENLYGAKEGTLCLHCEREKPVFERNTSLFDYRDDEVSSLLRKLKFDSNKRAAETLAHLCTNALKDFLSKNDFDLICPVPLSKRGEKERGFNQVELLLSDCGINFQPLLLRLEHEGHQSDLGRKERREFIKGQFEILEINASLITGKKILLVDDVFTTGSTAEECAKVLISGGAKSIEVFSFFRA